MVTVTETADFSQAPGWRPLETENQKTEDETSWTVIRDVHLSRHALRYKHRKTGLENHEPIKLCNHFTFGQSQRKYTFIIFQFNQTITDSRL